MPHKLSCCGLRAKRNARNLSFYFSAMLKCMLKIFKSHNMPVSPSKCRFAYNFSISRMLHSNCWCFRQCPNRKMSNRRTTTNKTKERPVWNCLESDQKSTTHKSVHTGGACSWTWSCLHVSQNKLSRSTLSCDISLYLAIKCRIISQWKWTNHQVFSRKFVSNEKNKHRKSKRKRNILACLMA